MHRLLALIALISIGAFAQTRDLVLTHINIVDVQGNRILADQDVVIDTASAKIKSIGKSHSKATKDAIDLRGQYLIPGLWDMHTHMAGLNADPKWSASLLKVLVAHGIVGIRDMGGSLTALRDWQQQIRDGRLIGPDIVTSGPMLDAEFKDSDVLNFTTPDEARKVVDTVAERGADFVKILSNATPAEYSAIADESKKRGMTFVGHVPPLVSASTASDSGQSSIEHFVYGGISIECSSRAAELREEMQQAMKGGRILDIAAVLEKAEATFDPQRAAALWRKMKTNHTAFTPTLISTYTNGHLAELGREDSDLRFLPAEFQKAWAVVPTSSAAVTKMDWHKKELEVEKALVKKMHDAAVLLLAGSDSLDPHDIPGSSLHHELRLLNQSGLTPAETLRTATSNAATFLKRPNDGTIAVGHTANLVVLQGNPLDDIAATARISAVILRGKYIDRSGLDHLRSSAEADAKAYTPPPQK